MSEPISEARKTVVTPTGSGAHAGYEWRSYRVTRKSGGGHAIGYLTVPAGHPWHGREADEIRAVGVPGGVTYAEPSAGGGGDWQVGFDTENEVLAGPGCLALCEAARVGALNPARVVTRGWFDDADRTINGGDS